MLCCECKEKARSAMGKQRSSPSGRKSPMRKRGMELLCAIARPPQECWSIRERINFRIALARFGQDWPRVAQFIATKTTDQICIYAHEYFKQRLSQDDEENTISARLVHDISTSKTDTETGN